MDWLKSSDSRQNRPLDPRRVNQTRFDKLEMFMTYLGYNPMQVYIVTSILSLWVMYMFIDTRKVDFVLGDGDDD